LNGVSLSKYLQYTFLNMRIGGTGLTADPRYAITIRRSSASENAIVRPDLKRRISCCHQPMVHRRDGPGLSFLPRSDLGDPRGGFTLVELMVVLAILVILSAVAIPSYSHYIEKARTNGTIMDIRSLERDIAIYFAMSGSYPVSLAAIGLGNVVDKWNNPYQYHVVTGSRDHNARQDRSLRPINSDYDLYSMGPDGKTKRNLGAQDSRDDIIRANNGEYIGIATDY
jgi:general secretion pathway protein G